MNYAFFGEEGMEKVRNGSVVIVGCGGVGSWAATMLVRSGVSRIRLIDFDYVTLSSLNRHAVATLEDVGTPKVFACQKYFKKVAPWVQVDAQVELWKDGEEGMNLLDGNIDWVVDAIDNITTKVQLLRACHQRGIKVFASMGAGAKTDPTRVQISDISNTYEDPLARSVRRRLRLEGVSSGIPVVYSTEIPGQVKLLPLAEEEFKKGAVHELGAFDDFRVRILPVLGPLPAVFGLHIATYILCEIAGKPIANPLATRNRKKLYEKLYKELGAREARLAGDPQQKRLPISETDVEYIFEDLHRGRSTIPPHAVLAKPVLARWDIREPLEKDGNIVVLSADDAQKLEAGGGIGERVWGDDVVDLVRRRAREAADVRKWNC
ncbi:hypothetical protein BOTBODRAFT_28795 [Botryobasidium botryosum FD-172 SS1]|uniref:THIF-type NAD/FAD binding fold domain-containing protein n=1 Tax=Botryobasidium botryosum (strain FD-172 SS1) TaxID=930990 RepID=A0A067MUM9_BOTB1|nr:hypothetical protein BOTBODRAFT_28795 [Botryobasidium botryosum FD-172 SS1]